MPRGEVAEGRFSGPFVFELKRSAREDPRLGQPQGRRHCAAFEHALPAAEHHRVDPHVHPVHQPLREQRLHQVETADHVDLAVAPLEPGHALGEVACEDAGAFPGQRLLERPAGDVLRDAIEQGLEVDLVGSGGPVSREEVVRAPAQQQCVHTLGLAEHDVLGFGVDQRHLPPAVLESVGGVLLGRADRLRDAVEGHVLGDDEFSHGAVLSKRESLPIETTQRS